jgi:hypothetical protein
MGWPKKQPQSPEHVEKRVSQLRGRKAHPNVLLNLQQGWEKVHGNNKIRKGQQQPIVKEAAPLPPPRPAPPPNNGQSYADIGKPLPAQHYNEYLSEAENRERCIKAIGRDLWD